VRKRGTRFPRLAWTGVLAAQSGRSMSVNGATIANSCAPQALRVGSKAGLRPHMRPSTERTSLLSAGTHGTARFTPHEATERGQTRTGDAEGRARALDSVHRRAGGADRVACGPAASPCVRWGRSTIVKCRRARGPLGPSVPKPPRRFVVPQPPRTCRPCRGRKTVLWQSAAAVVRVCPARRLPCVVRWPAWACKGSGTPKRGCIRLYRSRVVKARACARAHTPHTLVRCHERGKTEGCVVRLAQLRMGGAARAVPPCSSGQAFQSIVGQGSEPYRRQRDPKGGDLCPTTAKSWETGMEAGSYTDVQIVCLSLV